ncbi:MAG: hypothetical protein H6742_08390 [Alphaproteobacteria bacterium]|nr:hypothetical protein [Alphaproteobacteria bacterium]
MLRNIGAVLLGMLVGSILNMAVVMLNSYVLFPMPEGVSFEDPVAFGAYVADLPATAFVLVIVAHLLQAGGGGWVAARVGKSRPMVLAMIVGVLTLLGGAMNAAQLPLPSWTYIEFPLYLVVAYGAGWLEQQRRVKAGAA